MKVLYAQDAQDAEMPRGTGRYSVMQKSGSGWFQLKDFDTREEAEAYARTKPNTKVRQN